MRIPITGDIDMAVGADLNQRAAKVEITQMGGLVEVGVDLYLTIDALREMGQMLINSADKIEEIADLEDAWNLS